MSVVVISFMMLAFVQNSKSVEISEAYSSVSSHNQSQNMSIVKRVKRVEGLHPLLVTSQNYIYVLKQDTETDKMNLKIVLGDHTDYHHECKLHMVKYKAIQRLMSTQRHNRLFAKTEEKKRVPLDSWNQLYKICKGKTFTYVFRKTDGHLCLFLCETGPEKLDDLRCKHAWLAVHSGLLSDSGICCAGICTFQEDILFMDNMSGTYVPEEEHLVNMIGYLKKRLRTQNITPIIMISKPKLVFKHLDDKTAYTKFFKRSPDYKFAKTLTILSNNRKNKTDY